MTLNTPRRAPSPWSWKLIGLLQLGNAVAFGAVAATVDFSGGNSDEQTVAVIEATIASGETQATITDRSAEIEESPPQETPPSETSKDATENTIMPTFAVDPTSPLAEPALPIVEPTSPTPAVTQVQPAETEATRSALAAPAIANPASNALPVRFIVNGETVELQPGERRELTGGDMWVVRFHRGGEFGAAMEPIYDGAYQFVVGPQGWRLERAEDVR